MMHAIRLSVVQNRLVDGRSVTEASYHPFVQAGSAWVAEDRLAIVGFGALHLAERSVWALFVRPGCEGRGIGAALQRQMLQAAEERGLGRLWLSTGAGTRAESFYRRSGWTLARTMPNGELRFERTLPACSRN